MVSTNPFGPRVFARPYDQYTSGASLEYRQNLLRDSGLTGTGSRSS